jgi:hypothetical protein
MTKRNSAKQQQHVHNILLRHFLIFYAVFSRLKKILNTLPPPEMIDYVPPLTILFRDNYFARYFCHQIALYIFGQALGQSIYVYYSWLYFIRCTCVFVYL